MEHDLSSEYEGLKAILPDASEIPPTHLLGGYHGTCRHAPDQVFREGIPRKGSDRRLLEHVVGNEQSAFRGTTLLPLTSDGGQGAAHWAGAEGWVYQISPIPTWDTEQELEGKVPCPTGFTGSPHAGELESAIPAKVSNQRVVRVGKVIPGRGNHLKVTEWRKNPNLSE